jgi:trigger factor
LKIESHHLDDHQVKLTVEFEAEQFDEAKRRAARQLAKRVKIPGFRPGKAPFNVIVRHVGEEALIEEGVEILVDDAYPKVLEQADIKPYGPGKLENVSKINPLTLEFIVPLRAEVELGDYRSIRLPYEKVNITDEEVANVLDNLRQRQAIEETTDRPAEENDRLQIRISAHRYNSEHSDEEVMLIEEHPTSLLIAKTGEDTQDEWPFNGFSRELIGSNSGETKTILYTFSDDSDYESLRGETAEFSVQILDIKERTLPNLDDEFAHSLGDYQDLESLRKEIHESLEKRAVQEYNTQYDDQVVDKAVELTTIKYPPQMVEHEIDEVIHQLERRLKSQGLDLDTYLKTRQIDLDGLREEARPVAETRVKRSLVLFKIAEAEDIQVPENDLKQETDRTIESITQYLAEPERRKITSQEVMPDLVGNIYAEMRIERTLDHLRTIARSDDEAGNQSKSKTKKTRKSKTKSELISSED